MPVTWILQNWCGAIEPVIRTSKHSVDRCRYSMIVRDCLYDAFDYHFFCSDVKRHGVIANSLSAPQKGYVRRNSSRMKVFINHLTSCCLDRNDKSMHSYERIEYLAAEIQRLDMELVPDFELNFSISALPSSNDNLNQHFGDVDISEFEASAGVMARDSEIPADT